MNILSLDITFSSLINIDLGKYFFLFLRSSEIFWIRFQYVSLYITVLCSEILPTESDSSTFPTMLQFRVRATDDGNPAQFTEVNVQVSVQRVEIPIISHPFQNTIREDTQNGVSVLTVNASHPLGVSCHCLYFYPIFLSLIMSFRFWGGDVVSFHYNRDIKIWLFVLLFGFVVLVVAVLTEDQSSVVITVRSF